MMPPDPNPSANDRGYIAEPEERPTSRRRPRASSVSSAVPADATGHTANQNQRRCERSGLEFTKGAILERLNKKAEKGYGDIELLIEAQIGADRLPPERWDRIIRTLRTEAENTGFRHVHLVGALSPECRYFRLK
jgi:hypothetical protein